MGNKQSSTIRIRKNGSRTKTQKLSPADQHFYDTMAAHYAERADARPDVPMLQLRAAELKSIAEAGHKVIQLMPDPNDPNVLV